MNSVEFLYAPMSPCLPGTLTDTLGDGRFPQVTVTSVTGEKRTITVFGLCNPLVLFQKHAKETKHELERAIDGFGPRDYVLVQGHDYELGAQVYAKAGAQCETLYRSSYQDWTQLGLLDVYPRLRDAERFEYYRVLPFIEAEIKAWEAKGEDGCKVPSIPKLLDQENPASAVRVFEETWPERGWVEQYKRHTQHIFKEQVGLSEVEAAWVTEYEWSFAALMAALMALWRAHFFDIKLFVSKHHVPEIVDFLTLPGAQRQYIETLPGVLADIAVTNMHIQQFFTRIFTERQAVIGYPPWDQLIAQFLTTCLYEHHHQLRPSRLDFGEFVDFVVERGAATQPTDPCFCHSGLQYGRCACSDLVDDFQQRRAEEQSFRQRPHSPKKRPGKRKKRSRKKAR